MLTVINRTLFTEKCFSCVTRCRRFGKSMAAKMLCAYYDKSCDSRALFQDLEIASHPSFEQHLNKYVVLYLDMTDFMDEKKDEHIVGKIKKKLKDDIVAAYPGLSVTDDDDVMDTLLKVHESTGEMFFFIIDEWDAICREFKPSSVAMDDYVDWLRRMFKSASAFRVFAGVYMTGILPIKKYNTQSALNNFVEYSMIKAGPLSQFFGFTKEEVRSLAEKHGMDFDELEKWYDGYQIGRQISMFNPNSVMMAIFNDSCESYWASTGAYDAVAHYIQMNYEGLKDDVIVTGRQNSTPAR